MSIEYFLLVRDYSVHAVACQINRKTVVFQQHLHFMQYNLEREWAYLYLPILTGLPMQNQKAQSAIESLIQPRYEL